MPACAPPRDPAEHYLNGLSPRTFGITQKPIQRVHFIVPCKKSDLKRRHPFDLHTASRTREKRHRLARLLLLSFRTRKGDIVILKVEAASRPESPNVKPGFGDPTPGRPSAVGKNEPPVLLPKNLLQTQFRAAQ